MKTKKPKLPKLPKKPKSPPPPPSRPKYDGITAFEKIWADEENLGNDQRPLVFKALLAIRSACGVAYGNPGPVVLNPALMPRNGSGIAGLCASIDGNLRSNTHQRAASAALAAAQADLVVAMYN